MIKIVGKIKKLRDRVIAIESSFPIDFEENKIYSISIAEYRNKRSDEQNRYMWELITEIIKAGNGDRCTTKMKWELYTTLLKKAGAVDIYCEIKPKDIKRFKRSYRATEIVGYNILTRKIKAIAYIGTSEMDTKEMSDFIDYVLDYASEVGIYTEYWEGLLK